MIEFNFRSRDRFDRLALYKNARRIFAIVSTISIPISAPMIMEASVDLQPWGPDWIPITPQNGVLFACRNSDSRGAAWGDGRPDLPGLGAPLLRAAERRGAGGVIRGGEIVQKGLDFAWERSVSGSPPGAPKAL